MKFAAYYKFYNQIINQTSTACNKNNNLEISKTLNFILQLIFMNIISILITKKAQF